MNKPELLAPAGDMIKLKYALAYGADSVYAGVPIFSLRARENGFNAAGIREAIEYTHALGKKIYLTMNIFAHNSKIKTFLDSFCEMSELKPDGFIMSDIGLISQALKLRPDAVIHLSTQANTTNYAAVKFWADLGLKRVILSRELSIKEIAVMHEMVPQIELETFIHGAICISYSGRCLISNYLSHRDANQGTCTNSCRWEYKVATSKGSLVEYEQTRSEASEDTQLDAPLYTPLPDRYHITEARRPSEKFDFDEDEHGSYLMNSKDLCAIELLKDLVDAGVISFKIEGRSKGEYYLGVTTAAYRRAIDDIMVGKPFDRALLDEVVSTSNRTFMTGFYLRRPNEYGQNFGDGRSAALTHLYVGRLTSFDVERSIAWVELKNKVTVGDTIEWITPDGNIDQIVTRLVDKHGRSQEVMSGGVVAGIGSDRPLPEYTLARSCVSPAI